MTEPRDAAAPCDDDRQRRGTRLLVVMTVPLCAVLVLVSFSRSRAPLARGSSDASLNRDDSLPWRASYYDAPGLMGTPHLAESAWPSRDWATGGPAEIETRDWFSARWDTCMHVTRDETFTMVTSADDRARVRLDGVEILATQTLHREESWTGRLPPGVHYLVVELEEDTGNAFLHFALDAPPEAYRLEAPRPGRHGFQRGPCR